MILTRTEIIKEIKKKRIVITPFDKSAIGPASIDLTLDDNIRIFDTKYKFFMVDNKTDYRKITTSKNIRKGYLLKPGELILGITKEKITLPENICGWLNSRSRFARVGLMSHITAPFIAPGISNHQVLEIFNAGATKLKIMPGTKMCQLVLEQCKGNAKYNGIFKDQRL